MYGAAMFRFREKDFDEVAHHGGVSPAWPFGYDTLEPYYDEVERLYHVHGKVGLDPTEPRRKADYPLPPLGYEPMIEDLKNKLVQLGLRPFPLPMAVRLPQDYSRNTAPVKLENFDGFPDPTDSKADGQTSCLNKALQHANVSLVTKAYVEKLITDASGKKVTGVMAMVDGERQIYGAGLVILACGAVNSAALLLRSENEKHPQGLANSSGQVGRNLMLHHNGCLIAFTKKKNDSVFQKSFGLADYYFATSENEWPLGEIQLMGRNDPDTVLWAAEKLYPGKSYAELREMTIDFWLTAEDLPSADNRVTLRPDGTIQVHYTRNNYAAYEMLKEKLKELFVRLGKIDPDYQDTQWSGYDLDVSGMSHQNGTLRMGTNPKSSVVDTMCRTHEVSNLYVADASFFPSCGAFNPSLTIAANALRVGDYILSEVLGVAERTGKEINSNEQASVSHATAK
jgi:choline dehydrogenase-like flavoprotein